MGDLCRLVGWSSALPPASNLELSPYLSMATAYTTWRNNLDTDMLIPDAMASVGYEQFRKD